MFLQYINFFSKPSADLNIQRGLKVFDFKTINVRFFCDDLQVDILSSLLHIVHWQQMAPKVDWFNLEVKYKCLLNGDNSLHYSSANASGFIQIIWVIHKLSTSIRIIREYCIDILSSYILPLLANRPTHSSPIRKEKRTNDLFSFLIEITVIT